MKTLSGSLKFYLIKRFIVIMLLVAAVESLLRFLFTDFLFPVLTGLLFYTDVDMNEMAQGNFTMLFQILAGLLISGLFSLDIQNTGNGIWTILEKFHVTPVQIGSNINFPQNAGGEFLAKFYYFGLVCLFLILLFLVLLPFLAAAFYFGKIVADKVDVPMKKLMEGMDKVSSGELNTRLDFETEHEFIEIKEKFNEMAGQMEESARQKKEFEERRNLLLSDISHDLKTPITTIAGYACAMADGLIKEEEYPAYLEVIRTKSMKVDELIKLLFEYVKIDSEGFTLNPEEMDLCELIRKEVASLYADFEARKMTIDMKLEPFPVLYRIDPVQFSRVIHNILNNILKYNPNETEVEIRLKIEDHIRISFLDNGIPIEKELADHIFEPFVTGDKARRSGGGSGLGLSIAEKIISMHQGDLILRTKELGDFTKSFEIILPLKKEQEIQ